MAPPFVPAILEIEREIGHPLRDRTHIARQRRAEIRHFGGDRHRPVIVEFPGITDHRVIHHRIAVRPFEVYRRRRCPEVAERRETASDRESGQFDISHIQTEPQVIRFPEIGLNVTDDRPELAGMGDRLEIQGRSRRIELELLTLFRRIRHGNGRRYEIEIVGDPVEIVRKTRVHVTADTEDHLLVFTRNDELGQTGLAKPLFDRRIVQIDHLGRRHRVHFGPPAVDKKHIGFRIVLQHLGLQALRKETCDDRCCKKYTMFHNYGI